MRTRMLSTGAFKKKGWAALLGVSSLVLLTAGPAAAQTATVGSGAGTGYEYTPAAGTECGTPPLGIPSGVRYADDEFVLTHESTYESTDTSGPGVASFVGPATTTIKTGELRQAPQGAAPGGCSGIVVPLPVPLTTVTIDGTDLLGNTIHCDSPSAGGTYTRVNTTVAFQFTVLCDITSATGSVQNAPVTHVVEGNQLACFPLPCPPNPANPDPRGDASSVLT
ncbi:MAG: hypothetical protein ACR2G7_05850, partial [Acidimicrobiales bacterium]